MNAAGLPASTSASEVGSRGMKIFVSITILKLPPFRALDQHNINYATIYPGYDSVTQAIKDRALFG